MGKLLKVRCAYPVAVRTVYGTGEIVMDRDSGKATYVIGIKIRVEGEDKADLIDVQVVGEPVGIEEDDPVIIEGLSARFWEREGRAGITYRATSVRKVTEPAADPAASAAPGGPGRTGKAGGGS
jgi:hypothetical protein